MASAYLQLEELSKGSVKIGQFRVRVLETRNRSYEYKTKGGAMATQHLFECLLVGEKPEVYCVGFVKGTQAETAQAQKKYPVSSMWRLAKVAFDGRAETAYISTPLLFRVDMAKSVLESISAPQPDGKDQARWWFRLARWQKPRKSPQCVRRTSLPW